MATRKAEAAVHPDPRPRHNLEGIAWVIVGGESGNGARPLEEAWVLRNLEQCRAAGGETTFE